VTNPKSNRTKPAILGGPKAVTIDGTDANRWPIITTEDEAAVLRVLRDGDLSLHPVTRELERDYENLFGVHHALAHCNGTAALLAAFFAIDLRPGDEVLVPSATFWASVLPMLWLGAIPVFCESETERMGLDPEDVEARITPKTRAIVVVHLWGMPSRMSELIDIADRHNLKIVEDASHAQGASWRQRKCGTLGDVSVFSLQGSKLAPAGEGGILLTNDQQHYHRAICLGDIVRINELQTPERRFAATSFGIKTRMAPMSAAIARVQLRHLPERNFRRTQNLRYLSEALEGIGLKTFLPPPHIERVYFEYVIQFDADRWKLPIDAFLAALRAEGCEAACPRYPLLHQQPFFTEGHFARVARLDGAMDFSRSAYEVNALPRTEAANSQLVTLPTFPNADRALLDQYIAAFEKVLHHADAIAREYPSLP